MTEDRDETFARLRALPFEDLRAGEEGGLTAEAGDEPAPASEAPVPVEAAPDRAPPTLLSGVTYEARAADVTVRLLYPFRLDGRRIRSISIRPPRFDHVEAVLAGQITRQAMYAEMTSLSPETFGALRWPDAERVIGICADMAPE